MKVVRQWILGCGVLLPLLTGCAANPTTQTRMAKEQGHVFLTTSNGVMGWRSWRVQPNQNVGKAIIAEINSPEFRKLLADHTSATPEALEHFRMEITPGDEFWLKDYVMYGSLPDDACEVLQKYISLRDRDHTKAYAYWVLRQQSSQSDCAAEDVEAIREHDSDVIVSWLTFVRQTIENNQTRRYYRLIDGDVAWEYEITRNAKDHTTRCDVEKSSAVEFDPRFKDVFAEVERKLDAEHPRGFTFMGGCHMYWAEKQQMLRDRGIDWYTPAELNLDTIYD